MKTKLILLLVTIGFGGSIVSTGIISPLSLNTQPNMSSPLTKTKQDITRGSIHISSNNDFTAMGFPGLGTPVDPFRIENFFITTSSGEDLIRIEATTVHFRITNNNINGQGMSGTGIALWNVQNGIIENNEILNNRGSGIAIGGGSNIVVSNNRVHNNGGNSAFNHGNSKVNAPGRIMGDLSGINLNNARGHTIINNTIHDNTDWGIALEVNSPDNVMANNFIYDNRAGGIFIDGSNNIAINNIFQGSFGEALAITPPSRNTQVNFNQFSTAMTPQASDEGINSNITHNYWSDLAGSDLNEDGILDSLSYFLGGSSGNRDLNPLTSPSLTHQLTPPVLLSTNRGETLVGVQIIEWSISADSLGHVVVYAVLYSPDHGQSWTELVSNLTTTSYSWNTKSIPEGSDYLLKIVTQDSQGITSEAISAQSFAIRNIVIIDTQIITQTVAESPDPPIITAAVDDSNFLIIAGFVVIGIFAFQVGINRAHKRNSTFDTQTPVMANDVTCWFCGAFLTSDQDSCSECNRSLLTCLVCKRSIDFGEEIGTCWYCHNDYHYGHLAEWLKVKGTCPHCNEKLTEDEIMVKQIGKGKKQH